MSTVFDPNTGTEVDPADLMLTMNAPSPNASLRLRRKQLEERQARLQEAMAKGLVMPELKGQMVGGHYIPPSWGDALAPAVANAVTGYQAGQNEKALQAQGSLERAQMEQVLRALSGTPGTAATPFGSRDAPQQNATTGSPAPTGADRRVLIAQLMDNPAAGVIGADMLKDELVTAPQRAEAAKVRAEDREDRQVEARAALEANQQLRREQLAQQAEQAKQASEDRRLSIEQRREAAQMHAQLMAQLSADRLAAKANAPEKPAKPLPNAVHKELSGLEDTAANMTQLASTFKPEYAGPKAAIAVAAAPYFPEALVPGKAPDATAEWWKNYKKQSELVERHALFGASLTANEQASWKSADISPGMGEKTIKTNLDKRKSIADKMFANAVDRYEKGGHANVREAFNPAAIRSTGGAEGSWGGAPTVVRTGTRNGKRVEQLSDGSIRDAK